MDWQTFLISQKGWRDDEGNTLCFSDCDLNGKKKEGVLWMRYWAAERMHSGKWLKMIWKERV